MKLHDDVKIFQPGYKKRICLNIQLDTNIVSLKKYRNAKQDTHIWYLLALLILEEDKLVFL